MCIEIFSHFSQEFLAITRFSSIFLEIFVSLGRAQG
jgi:hypothetical protein